jgi:hypothetical protein
VESPRLGRRVNVTAKKIRYFIRYWIEFSARHKKGAPLRLVAPGKEMDVFSAIQEAIDDDTAKYEITNDDIVRITKVEKVEGGKVIAVLFRRRNESIAMQVLEHKTTKKLREPEKAKEESPVDSCHLFIRIEPEKGRPHAHRVVLEEVPGIGRTYVHHLLRIVLHGVEYEYADAKNNIGMTYTVVKFEGMPSETLAAALKGGGMNYLELERAPDLAGLDNEGISARPIVLRLTVKAEAKNRMALVTNVRAWGKAHNWPDLRVQVRTSEDKTRVVKVAREADAGDTLFLKAELVQTKGEMKPATDEINKELAQHATKFFGNDKDWK